MSFLINTSKFDEKSGLTIAMHLCRLSKTSTNNGQNTLKNMKYLDRCKYYDRRTGTLLIFTRDVAHHLCGWWKNPDYDQCFHLSISYRDPVTQEHAPQYKKFSFQWCQLFFGNDINKLWVEPPFTENGKLWDVYHYRLFCNEQWIPIMPRKEVYSKEFTEQGWKSFSEVHSEEKIEEIKND